MDLEDIFHLHSENEDYVTILEQHIDMDYYTDITHFLDRHYPGWDTRKKLGTQAPEFILLIIEYLEEMRMERLDHSPETYEEIDDLYRRFDNDFPSDKEVNEFEDLYDEEINQLGNECSYEEYSKNYDKYLKIYLKSIEDEVPYVLRFKDYKTFGEALSK